MNVTILTPIHNDERTLPRALAAIAALDWDGRREHLLIDDGSTDDSPRLAQEFAARQPGARYLRKPAGGEASALNLGLQEATGDWIAILEADVEPAADWLRIAAAELADPRVIAVGGYLETPPDDPWVARLAGYEAEIRQPATPQDVDHLTSANVLYRAAAFREAGRFDERLFNSCLDMEFNQRLRARGHRLRYQPAARVRHHFKPSLWGFLSRNYAYGRYRPLLPRQIGQPGDLAITLQLALSLLLAGSLLLACRLPGAPPLLAAIFIGLQIPGMLRLHRHVADPVLWLLPLLTFLRNLAGLAGLAVGWLEKILRPQPDRENR
ncbi:MAG: glycosyltransferase [Myxococcales bacterium]|nr:glycosyltransferase [Myxococcales bacterium]